MEQLLHYVWKHKLFPLRTLVTTQGEPLEIIDPGLPNPDAGPDFFNAKIKINGVLWVGNVEIHLRASDWLKHHHEQDTTYDSVILHVASDIDTQIQRTNGEPIPQLELHYPPYLLENYQELLATSRYPACYRLIPTLPPLLVHSWTNTLQLERFEQKTAQLLQRLETCNRNWEDAFFLTLARNFGFGTNSEAFELWAKSIPLRAVDKHRDNLFQIEAIFFGQAGLIPEQPGDSYTESLQKEYAYLQHKFGLTPSSHCQWKLLRTRPGNFPYLRIAQLAYLYQQSAGLLSQVLEKSSLDEVRRLFQGDTSPYWITHYSFGEISRPQTKHLSKASIDLLIINTVVPFLYAYGKYRGQASLTTRAGEFLEALKPENNYITRMWKECGLTAAHAGDSQALIQLKKQYCDPKKCLYCRIGYEYFKRRK